MTTHQRLQTMDKVVKQLHVEETDDFLTGILLTLYSLEPMYTGGGFLLCKTAVHFVLANGERFMTEPIVDGHSPRKAILSLRHRLLKHAYATVGGTDVSGS